MTVGVYGFVAAVVKMDDAGLWLLGGAGQRPRAAGRRALGHLLLALAPRLLGLLSVLGTLAMFLVGGGIIAHGAPILHPLLHHLQDAFASGGLLRAALSPLFNTVVGVLAGAVVLLCVKLSGRLRVR
jgi:predicted DNA repair protein MutK